MNALTNGREFRMPRRIERREALTRLAQTLQRATAPGLKNSERLNILARGTGSLMRDVNHAERFTSLGEHLQAIAAACRDDGGAIDPRLVRAPAGANIDSPIAGGFLVAEEWAAGLVGLAYEEAILAPLCDRRETARPLADVKIPGIDETSRAEGSRWGGFVSYWQAEGSSAPKSFPKWKLVDFSAKKIIGATNVSNELLQDAPMLGAHLARGFAAEFGFKLDLAALSGTGAGMPQGMLASSALITVAKAAGQAAATVVAENISSMWERLPAPSRKRAVWLVNEDVETQLDQAPASNAIAGMYMPRGAAGNPFPLLKGRPLLVMEQSPALGQVGDIVLCDPSHYIIVDGGMRPMLSAHARFDNDETVFRFTLRVDGKGGFTSPITPYNSSKTRSPFVALAAR